MPVERGSAQFRQLLMSESSDDVCRHFWGTIGAILQLRCEATGMTTVKLQHCSRYRKLDQNR